MTVTEETRLKLYRRLQDVLGPEEAATFMELVPPVGWADVATKRDLDHLEVRMGQRIEAARSDLRVDLKDGLTTVQRDMRLQLFAVLAFNMSLFGAAVGLIGR